MQDCHLNLVLSIFIYTFHPILAILTIIACGNLLPYINIHTLPTQHQFYKHYIQFKHTVFDLSCVFTWLPTSSVPSWRRWGKPVWAGRRTDRRRSGEHSAGSGSVSLWKSSFNRQARVLYYNSYIIKTERLIKQLNTINSRNIDRGRPDGHVHSAVRRRYVPEWNIARTRRFK